MVIALCSQSFLQKLLKSAKKAQNNFNNIEIPKPWKGFREELVNKIQNVAVSVRPDHSIQGAFFEETAYGILKEKVKDNEKNKYYNLSIRQPVEKITLKTISSIKDEKWRNIAKELADGLDPNNEKDKKEFAERIKREFERRGIYKLKVYTKQISIIPIEHPQSKPRFLKGYISDQVHHLSVWEYPNGEWKCFGVSIFTANQCKTNKGQLDDKALTHFLRTKYNKDRKKCLHPAARHIMKLHKGDTVFALDRDGSQNLWIVKSLKPSPSNNRIVLVDINTPNPKVKNPLYLSFSKFKSSHLRKIKPNILGYKLDSLP